jgi:solute carrier family 25 iron transporter 28/37
MNPFDVIKQRMQLHGSEFKSILACTRHILRNEGFSAFYISYPATLLLNVPFHFVQFSTYEKVRNFLNPRNRYDPVSHVVAGAAAGITAAAVTTPIDVVKTLLQTKGESSSMQVRQVSGVLNAVKIIYSAEGLGGFLRGWKPRVLTHMPSTAICWTTYEYFKWLLSSSNTSI